MYIGFGFQETIKKRLPVTASTRAAVSLEAWLALVSMFRPGSVHNSYFHKASRNLAVDAQAQNQFEKTVFRTVEVKMGIAGKAIVGAFR